MKRSVVLCVVSALLGAGVAIGLWHGPSVEPRSVAQDVIVPVIPPAAPPAVSAPPAVTDPRLAFDYTPEERVNISVYEDVNRGVVNITTRGFQGDRFLMIEIPSEGEGSGVVLDRQGHILTNSTWSRGPGRSRWPSSTAIRTRPGWWARTRRPTWR